MNSPDVIIIGAGISGLAAAWRVKQLGYQPLVLEKSSRVGGLVHSKRENGSIIEFGPDGVITRKPWAIDLMRELGLEDQIIPVNSTQERIYILGDGDLHPLPKGLKLLIPTDKDKFMQTQLLSKQGKERAVSEDTIPRHTQLGEETMADFVTRRLGREMLDKIAEPLLAGVYNGEAEKLSMHATFPQFPALEQKYGSLINGIQSKEPPSSSSGVSPVISLKQGMSQLPERLANELSDSLHLNEEVKEINSTSSSFEVKTQNDVFKAPKLILTSSTQNLAKLVEYSFPEVSNKLREFSYEGVGSVSLIYDKSQVMANSPDLEQILDAYGIVIPAIEGRNIDGMQFSSSKWKNRSSPDHILLRVFYGGPNTRYMLEKSDEDVLTIIRSEIHDILGIEVQPVKVFLRSWGAAYPQYHIGHKERVEQLMNLLPEGMAVAGNTYYGVGIPDTIKSANSAVKQLFEN